MLGDALHADLAELEGLLSVGIFVWDHEDFAVGHVCATRLQNGAGAVFNPKKLQNDVG